MTAGFALVPIADKDGIPQKGPRTPGWNTPENLVTSLDDARMRAMANGGNVGVCHAHSGTVCLDIDDRPLATTMLRDVFGIDLDVMLRDSKSVQTTSGKAERAKLWFLAPDGVQLERCDLSVKDSDGNSHSVLDLRAGANQDVLPPSIHPDTGQAYEWKGADWREMPELPADWLELWQKWPESKALLLAYHNGSTAELKQPQQPKGNAATDQNVAGQIKGTDLLELFNQQHTLATVLERNGYVKKGDRRYLRKGSTTGAAGLVLLTDAECYSHSGDGLADGCPHDAFDVMRILEHTGNWRSAFTAAEQVCTAPAGGTVAEHNLRLWMAEQQKDSSNSEGISGAWQQQDQASSSAAAEHAFAELMPLGPPAPPEFPVAAMPYWTQDFIKAEATCFDTPPDIAANAVIGTLATSVAKKVVVQVNETHTQPAALYIGIIAPPGGSKTPIMDDAKQPLVDWETEEGERVRPDVIKSRTDHEMREAEKKFLISKVFRADGDQRKQHQDRIAELDEEMERNPPRKMPRLISDDFTPAALMPVLAANNGRLAIYTSEGKDFFQTMLGKHSNNGGTDTTLVKKAWCEEAINIDRIGRQGDRINKPLLNITLGIQPDVMLGIDRGDELFGEGVLDRFLFVCPESGMLPPDPEPVPRAVLNGYSNGVRSLLAIPVPDQPQAIRLSQDAHDVNVAFARFINGQCEPGGELEEFRGFGTKLRANVLRLAGVLHMADNVCDPSGMTEPISGETMEDAEAIARYWLKHAVTVFGRMATDSKTKQAQRLWKWIQPRAKCGNLGPTESPMFSVQQLWQGIKSGNRHGVVRTTKDRDTGLEELEEAGYIKRAGQVPATYRVNPLAVKLY